MKRGVSEILDELRQLDLLKNPYDQVHRCVQELGKFGVILTTFGPGKTFVRARPNEDYPFFSEDHQLSFKPAKFNTEYRRASTPNQTMFYGALRAEDYRPKIDPDERITAAAEACSLIRNKAIKSGEQVVTFGRWRVTKPIHVIAIAHAKDFITVNPALKQLHDDYRSFMSKHPTKIVDDSVLISDFFATEFAKEEINSHYEYLLSAVYAERMANAIQEGIEIAGVLYPSVRTAGRGFNVAINPTIAANNLKLISVLQCTLYKKDDLVMGDNDKVAIVPDGYSSFKLEDITDESHLGRKMIYKILNGEVKIK